MLDKFTEYYELITKGENISRLKFISFFLLFLFSYFVLCVIGDTLEQVLVLGIGDLCTLLGFSMFVLFSVKANYRVKLIEFIKTEILTKNDE